MTPPSIQLEGSDLCCVRGARMLFRGINFKLRGGEMLQIHGHNGAGKTSLLRLLCGLSQPEYGTIRFNGVALAHATPDYYAMLTYLGHRSAVSDELSPLENLRARAGLRTTCAVTPSHALRILQLEPVAHVPCGQLSSGQRQRVGLAGLLLQRGGVWLLDEPAAALDDPSREILSEMLRTQVADGGMVIFTSHQPLADPVTHHIHLQHFV